MRTPLGNITSYAYDPAGNRTGVTNPLNLTSVTVYDAANRRADYIVGVEEPLVAKGVRAPWYKLQ